MILNHIVLGFCLGFVTVCWSLEGMTEMDIDEIEAATEIDLYDIYRRAVSPMVLQESCYVVLWRVWIHKSSAQLLQLVRSTRASDRVWVFRWVACGAVVWSNAEQGPWVEIRDCEVRRSQHREAHFRYRWQGALVTSIACVHSYSQAQLSTST